MLLSIFLTDKVLFFPHFDFIRRFIIGSRLHIYMYIIPWHTVFSADSCPLLSASRRTKLRYRFFSVLVMLTIRCLISWVILFWRDTSRSHHALYPVTVTVRLRGWLNVGLTFLYNRSQNLTANMCLHHPYFLFLFLKCNIVVINTKFKFT